MEKEIKRQTNIDYDEMVYRAFNLFCYDREAVDEMTSEGRIVIKTTGLNHDPIKNITFESRMYLLDGMNLFDISIMDVLKGKIETEYKHVEEYERRYKIHTRYI